MTTTTYSQLRAGDRFTPMGTTEVWVALTDPARIGISSGVQFRALSPTNHETWVVNESYRPVYRVS